MEINPYGAIYSAPDITIEVATFRDANEQGLHDVLLKMKGALPFSEGMDGKTVRYSVVPVGQGQDFIAIKAGRRFIRMSVRPRAGEEDRVEAYVNGKTIAMKFDKKQTEMARPLHLLTEYQESLASAPSRLQIERQLPDVNAKGAATGWKGRITLAWNGHNEIPEARISAFALLEALPRVLADLQADKLGRDAISAFDELAVTLIDGTSLSAQTKGRAILVQLGCYVGADGIYQGVLENVQACL